MMGSDSGGSNETPVHQVTVPSFEMNRTEVTVAQYQACVDAGVCIEPTQCGSYYNWGVAGREDHPVNCVDWYQSVAFCAWAGGRLLSGSEWEYAARSRGQDCYYSSYTGAPADGSAWEGCASGADRVIRGGGFDDYDGHNLRSANRNYNYPSYRIHYSGFRCAR